MKTYKSLISKFGLSAFALTIAVGFVVIASVALAVPPTCWCCTKGKVARVQKTDCQKGGGHCYGTQAEANKACGIRGGRPNRDQPE